MAIVLGRKVVRDTEEFNDFAIGLSLPIQITNVAFNQNFDTISQVKTNIINLLKTRQGERLMHPDFGSGLHRVLFSQMDDDTFTSTIEETIESTIEKWLPYVGIEEIDVNISSQNKDRNTAEISITFSVNENEELTTVTFTVDE
jgi:phage baseplate assembly protein W